MDRTIRRCFGRWKESWLGWQPMEDLVLEIDGDKITGSGTDVIGEFRLKGFLSNNQVSLAKKYRGQHLVEYVGEFDGVSTMSGLWAIDGWVGEEWQILLSSCATRRPDDGSTRDLIRIPELART